MKYRMIPFRYFSAAMNMAIDETLMEGIRAGGAPVIRFYGWEPSAVSIGYFQGLEYEVNREACRRGGVDVVRRITGGGAVFHDRDGEITYSILGPLSEFPADVIESYRLICGHLIDAFAMLGIEAAFQPINDVTVDEKKISGNAQARKRGVFLQHGTILYRVSVETMFTLLTVSEEKVSDKLIRSVKKRVTSLTDVKPVAFEELAAALERAFSQGREVELGDYTEEELTRARQLAAEKYSTEAWIAMR
ncbi:MAG: lipoate--protein ligase family protein [Anaerolineaceae bacterium]|nr:lipoate--protein ligase family protein [Anaerolineaceae bacterium]